jgi:hypothetical protein
MIDSSRKWYVMRDLKRPNALLPAYKFFQEKHVEVFTPLKRVLKTKDGKRVIDETPIIRDLLFVHESKAIIDSLIKTIPTIQFRFEKGKGYCVPMVVSESEMARFIHAVGSSDNTKYYLPDDLTPSMLGKRIKIIGGPLDGYEGALITTRGSKVKRLLVKLENYLTAGVEVSPEFIQVL